MTQVLIHDGKLDRQAAADALRQFLENVVRVSKLELKVNVRPISAEGEGSGGGAEGCCRNSHGECGRRRRTTSRHSSRGQQTFPVVPLCHKNNEGQPVLPGGPALREHVSVCAESHAVSEGCRAVAAYLHKTDVRDLHNGDVAFLVETRNWESREP